ncbi:hypothetical protein NOK12_14490 [Nocardioides sp. OK12]|nr:hypothetical protein NOK12_14490 [Nocardioides sp. OK12]
MGEPPYFPLVTTTTQSSRPALSSGWSTLSRALVVVLGLALLGNAVNAVFSSWAWRTFAGWASDPASIDQGRATAYDAGTVVTGLVLVVLHIMVLVLMIIWLFQAHRSDRMDPARLEHRSGWAIGGWFVPVLNLWRPYQMVEDVRLGSRSGSGPSTNVVLWWWISVVGASIADRVTSVLLGGADPADPDYFSALANANLSDVVASALWVAAAVLGILVVKDVTEAVEQSPHAPAPARA